MSGPATPSLCLSCSFVREVHGRRGQVYLLCRNEAIEAKYLPQPVLECHGYDPVVAQESISARNDDDGPR